MYAAVLPYEKVCCEDCRLRGAPPPTLEESERSWVVLMLYWCAVGEGIAEGYAGVDIVQMEMEELDEEGGLLEDVVASRSSKLLRWADELFALGMEESLLRLRPRLPSGGFALINNGPVLPPLLLTLAHMILVFYLLLPFLLFMHHLGKFCFSEYRPGDIV